MEKASKALQIFKHKEFGRIRVIMRDGEPWFIGNEVASVLGYADPRRAIYTHCKYAILLKQGDAPLLNLPSRGINIIPESDIYRLIMKSELPNIEGFQDWVCSEVLPSIRKTGSYSLKDSLPDFTKPAEAARAWADQYEQRQIAEKAREVAEYGRMIADATIIKQRPKVKFAEAVESSKTSILVGEMAKILSQNGIKDIGQNRFFDYLRDEGFLIKRKGTDRNMPTQKSMELGLFEIKERTIINSDGSIRITKTPKITGKGQRYFVDRLLP